VAVLSLLAPRVTAILPNQSCTICQNGQNPSLPDKFLSLPGLPQMQCGSIDSVLALYVPNATSSTCATVQSLGSLCGCPVRSDSCSLCPDGNPASLTDNELPFLSDLFQGFTPTCEVLEAYLASQSPSDAICYVSQSFISTYCGCNVDQQEKQQNLTGVESSPCSLCRDGAAFRPSQSKHHHPGLSFQDLCSGFTMLWHYSWMQDPSNVFFCPKRSAVFVAVTCQTILARCVVMEAQLRMLLNHLIFSKINLEV
jgi:hypothetical protein